MTKEELLSPVLEVPGDPPYPAAVMLARMLLKYATTEETLRDLDHDNHSKQDGEMICMAQQIIAEATGLVGVGDD